jgi:hypothetical protein
VGNRHEPGPGGTALDPFDGDTEDRAVDHDLVLDPASTYARVTVGVYSTTLSSWSG